MSLLWSLACSFGLGQFADSAPVEEELPVWIDSVSPSSGSTAGGTTVTIIGGGFEGTVYATFGGGPVTATVIDSSTITVVTPRVSETEEVVVDVVVQSDLGLATANGAFTFVPATDTTTDDSGTTPDDSGTVPTALPDGFVELSFTAVACPSCFNLSQASTSTAYAAFHEEAGESWLASLPSEGTCTTSFARAAPTDTFADLGDAVTLTTGSTTITLDATPATQGVEFAAELADGEFVFGSTYELGVTEGPWGAFTATPVLTTPQDITQITPSNLMIDVEASAWSAPLAPTGFVLAWGPSGTDAPTLIQLDMYSSAGSGYLGSVWCYEADDGAVEIASSTVSAFPTGTYVAVTFMRYQVGAFTLPDGGVGESVGIVGVTGTGRLQ